MKTVPTATAAVTLDDRPFSNGASCPDPLDLLSDDEGFSPTDAAIFRLQDFEWTNDVTKDLEQSLDAFLEQQAVQQTSAQPPAMVAASRQGEKEPSADNIHQHQVTPLEKLGGETRSPIFNRTITHHADFMSQPGADQSLRSSASQSSPPFEDQTIQLISKQDSSSQSLSPSIRKKMSPSTYEVERFNDRDENTGRPKLQQSWINYALRIMKRDETGEIWHSELREKIMQDLEQPVTVNNLTVSWSAQYKNLTKFARGKKQPYPEVALWAILFRNENGLPSVWSNGDNSDTIWAFSDVINAIADDESKASIMSNYEKTRDRKEISYFKPAIVNTLAQPISHGNSQAQYALAVKSKKRKNDDDDRIEIELLSDIESKINEAPLVKRRRPSTGNYISPTVEKRQPRQWKNAGDKTAANHGPATQTSITDGERHNSFFDIVKSKKAKSDVDIDPESEGETAMNEEAADDDEPMDSWMVEAMKIKEDNEQRKEELKITPKQKVEQRNKFFKAMAAMPKDYQEMAFRTSVLDMLQDLGHDPNFSLGKQIKRYKMTVGDDEKQGKKV